MLQDTYYCCDLLTGLRCENDADAKSSRRRTPNSSRPGLLCQPAFPEGVLVPPSFLIFFILLFSFFLARLPYKNSSCPHACTLLPSRLVGSIVVPRGLILIVLTLFLLSLFLSLHFFLAVFFLVIVLVVILVVVILRGHLVCGLHQPDLLHAYLQLLRRHRLLRLQLLLQSTFRSPSSAH